jgi:serine/threonine-protein kinase
LYAVGLVLYEMLAGRGAFDHHPDWKLISIAQLEEIPAPVSKFAPWVPPSIVELLVQVLAKDPRQRPRDAYAFAERLYDLEWASDGTKPRGETVRGHAPLAAMLTSIGAKKGDAPPIGVPAASVHPQAGGVIIRSGSDPHLGEAHGPTTPRAAAVRSFPQHDTFASQHSDARPAQRSKTLGMLLLATALLFSGLAIATTIVIRGRERPAPTFANTEPPPPIPTLSASEVLPSPTVSASASAAPVTTTVAPLPKPRGSAAAPKPTETSSRSDYAREL